MTALAVGVALAVPIVRIASRRHQWTAVAAGALGVGLALAAYLSWNAATTGDP